LFCFFRLYIELIFLFIYHVCCMYSSHVILSLVINYYYYYYFFFLLLICSDINRVRDYSEWCALYVQEKNLSLLDFKHTLLLIWKIDLFNYIKRKRNNCMLFIYLKWKRKWLFNIRMTFLYINYRFDYTFISNEKIKLKTVGEYQKERLECLFFLFCFSNRFNYIIVDTFIIGEKRTSFRLFVKSSKNSLLLSFLSFNISNFLI
jgi:hypothetical protein